MGELWWSVLDVVQLLKRLIKGGNIAVLMLNDIFVRSVTGHSMFIIKMENIVIRFLNQRKILNPFNILL